MLQPTRTRVINMHAGEISFCDGVAYNIKSEDVKQHILKRLERKYGLRIIHKHYDKFDESVLDRLVSNPHLVCVRSNGNPYFLCFTRWNDTQCCLFIDKKVQHGYSLPRIIIVHMNIADELFEDTIIDGEMVKTQDGQWCFLCNDIVVHRGNHLINMNLSKRINMMYDMWDKSYDVQPHDLFLVAVKHYFRYGDDMYANIMDHINALPYTCRGLYFRPIFLKFKDILYNFNNDLIKKVERTKYKEVKTFILLNDEATLKEAVTMGVPKDVPPTDAQCFPVSNSMRIFKVKKTSSPDVYELYNERSELESIACIPTMSISKYMRSLTKTMNMVDKVDVMCEFSEKFRKWIPCLPSSA